MVSNKPEWLRIRVKSDQKTDEVFDLLNKLLLHTVCEEANCPNLFECFGKKVATFLIMGNICTRNCTFCNVQKGKPLPLDEKEPFKVAQAVKDLNLRYVVVTSVTRDDIEDGGAEHFAKVVQEIRNSVDDIKIELLIPDFKGDIISLEKVTNSKPDVISHNVETVPRLYQAVRPMADYERSLKVLKDIKWMDKRIFTKSGLMVGLGEKKDEVKRVLVDLREVGCDFVTIGQYLSPSKHHHPVVEYIHPEVFEEYKQFALSIGFKYVASAPFVRSSYMAEEALNNSQ